MALVSCPGMAGRLELVRTVDVDACKWHLVGKIQNNGPFYMVAQRFQR